MQQYQVSYSFGSDPNTAGLTMVVSAYNMAQARQIVESMHGGSSNCRTYSAILLG